MISVGPDNRIYVNVMQKRERKAGCMVMQNRNYSAETFIYWGT